MGSAVRTAGMPRLRMTSRRRFCRLESRSSFRGAKEQSWVDTSGIGAPSKRSTSLSLSEFQTGSCEAVKCTQRTKNIRAVQLRLGSFGADGTLSSPTGFVSGLNFVASHSTMSAIGPMRKFRPKFQVPSSNEAEWHRASTQQASGITPPQWRWSTRRQALVRGLLAPTNCVSIHHHLAVQGRYHHHGG